MTPADFREAMSRVVGAVHIVTTAGPDGDAGITATAVCSVSDEPPTVLVCLNRRARALAAITASGVLAVNLLGGDDRDLADLFAGRGGVDMPKRFAAARWMRLATGAPILQSSEVALDCRVTGMQDVGTHRVLFCAVVDVAGIQAGHALVYAGRRYARHAVT